MPSSIRPAPGRSRLVLVASSGQRMAAAISQIAARSDFVDKSVPATSLPPRRSGLQQNALTQWPGPWSMDGSSGSCGFQPHASSHARLPAPALSSRH